MPTLSLCHRRRCVDCRRADRALAEARIVSALIRRPLRARRFWQHAAHSDGGLQLPLLRRDDGWLLQGAAAVASYQAKRAALASESPEASTR